MFAGMKERYYKNMKIVLASASPRRKELLIQMGLQFEVKVSKEEEKTEAALPQEMVEQLSGQKAWNVISEYFSDCQQDILVIGADTIVVQEKEIFGKPKSKEDACRMLRCLQGKNHQVYTGVTLCYQPAGKAGKIQQLQFYEKTIVSFFPMSEEEIQKYIASGEPMDKAGAYGIQGQGACYISGIQGDYNNVVGLPIGRLYQEIKKLCSSI